MVFKIVYDRADDIVDVMLPFFKGYQVFPRYLKVFFEEPFSGIAVIDADKFHEDDPLMKTSGLDFILFAVDIAVFHLEESVRKVRIGINTNITPHAVRGNDLTDCKKI